MNDDPVNLTSLIHIFSSLNADNRSSSVLIIGILPIFISDHSGLKFITICVNLIGLGIGGGGMPGF
jgi:hypothetical protein